MNINAWLEAAQSYRDRRLLVIFLLGMASGYPWVLIGSAMTAWLQDAGLDRAAIGYFGSVFAVYAVNFMWAPLLDRIRLPFGSTGQRRSWILLTQCLLFVLTLAIGLSAPSENSIFWTSIIAIGIALSSATQDIAIDAYRIAVIGQHEKQKIAHGAAMATAGWWTGYGLLGALPFLLVGKWGLDWQGIYMLLAAIWLPFIVVVRLIPDAQYIRAASEETKRLYRGGWKQLWQQDWKAFLATALTLLVLALPLAIILAVVALLQLVASLLGSESLKAQLRGLLDWVAETLFEPLREFFTRHGVGFAVTVLAFIFLFKIGEAFLGRMSIVFYKEVGFTNEDIGIYSKLVGWWVTIVFSIIGSFISARFGIVRGLMLGGIAMAASNLMFSWIASVGPDTNLLMAAVIVDGFTGALATVAFVTFISWLTSHQFSATQYALMASLGNLGRTTLAAFSGEMVNWLGGDWQLFFIITALMVLPSLALLLFMAPGIKRRSD